MAQNLSFIEKELIKVKQAAADTTRQMADLENQLRRVIQAGQSGRGALLMTGADVGRVAQQTIGAVGSRHAPTGSRGMLEGDTVSREMNRLALEIKGLEGEIQIYKVAQQQLSKAELALAQTMQEHATAENAAVTVSRVRTEIAYESIAAGKAIQAASAKLPKTLGERVAAGRAEIRAAEELAKAELELAKQTKLGALTRGETTKATDIARKGQTSKAAEAEKYTQAKLEGVFAKQPGAATEISRVAAKSGFTPEHIKRVTEYANAYTQVQYAVTRTDGVMRKMVLTTDRAGNVFTSTQKQFRTFFSAIRRNVTEMIKWSAATLVVWGAIRKLGELLEIAIENETKLASIAVILGEEHADLTQVFNSAAEAAAATGEAIDGVLEGYVQAYRATGNIADQAERARQAQVLLTDALTLSKLSSMSTAQAMDTLTGALRQAGLGFEEGYILLDKWVAVSRQANVSIETLAESFAITATSASNAGLTWDELNGVIATLAESTTLSATESGNAIRAFIGGFSTDLSVKELSKFGIAVEDTTGETRGFLDVMKEIAAMFEQGIISEGELNKIARAIGGRGARRGAQVATTIKNLGRAQEVAEVSARAHGDAQRALGIQLDTVQTAITKLGNSFQKLARAMGAEGGVLGVAGTVLDIFTKMVDATSSLVKNLGDMTPILAVMGGLFAATSVQTRGLFATNIAAGVGGILGRFGGGRGGGQQIPIEQQRMDAGLAGGFATAGQPMGLGGRVSQGMLAPGIGRNAGSRLGQGIGVGFAAVSAIRDLSEGNKAGAAGSIAGGIIGGLISGGSPIGIVIGSAAGEAFANATFNYKADFTRFFSDIFDEVEPGKDPGDPTDREAATSAIFAELGFGSEGLGKFFAKTLSVAGNIGYQGAQVLGNVTGGVGIGDYRFAADVPGAEITPEQIALRAGGGGQAAMGIYNLKAQQEALKGFQAERKPGGETFAVTDAQEQLLKEYQDFLVALEATQADIVRAGAVAGDITTKDLQDALDQIPKLQAILTKYEVAFGDEIRKVNDEVVTVTDSFEYWTNIVVNGSTEQKNRLNAVAQEIAGIRNAIELAAGGKVTLAFDDSATLDVDESKVVSTAQAYEILAEKLTNVGIEAQSMTRAINQARIDIPGIVNIDVSKEDFDIILKYAEELQDDFWEGFWSEGVLSDFSESDLEDTLAPFMLQAGADGGMKYVEGFNASLIQQAAAEKIATGEVTKIEDPKKRGLQTLDISSGQLPAVMARYQELVGITAQAGYVPDEETFAALFTDYIAMPITADLTLLNIAMQELIDVSKDQLDGIYNLPTDASFYVPFTGYQLGFVNQGAGGGGGLPAGIGGTEEETAVEEIAKVLRPDRWQIEQDARIQNMKDKLRIGTDAQPADAVGVRSRWSTLADPEPFGGLQLERPDVVRQEWLSGLLKQGIDLIRPDAPLEQLPGGTAGAEVLNTFRDLINSLFGLGGEDPTITTKLQIESTTTTIVQLDGQVIANAIKPYLLNDQVRYEGTGGSAVKRFVI